MKIKETWQKYKKKLSILFSILKIPSFAVIIGFLGSYAGSQGTSLLWRRVGITSIITVCAYITSGLNSDIGWIIALWHITIMSLWGAYSCGYGIPDASWPPKGDSGSDIGRFFTLLFRKFVSIPKAHRIANYFTRSTISILKCIALLSIPILKRNWIWYIIGSIVIILVNAIISWRGLGSFKQKIFNKEVNFLWSDIITFTIEGLCYYIIIFWR